MKKKIRSIVVLLIFAVMPLINNAQPPHPNSPSTTGGGNAPNQNGQTNVPVGGGAPIDGGFSILLAMGAIYGFSKIYSLINNKDAEVNMQ